MASISPPKVIFITSAPYSGSTWVGYVLGSATASAFLGEYYRAWSDRLRQPCTLCAGRGLPECVVLHGVEKQPPAMAYHFASDRLGGKVVVDSSKDLEWIRKAVTAQDLDASVVTVVRDPRGWIASMKRRNCTDSTLQLIDRWVEEYFGILDFVDLTAIPSTIVSYDLLASRPMSEFAKLYEFCGLSFEPACLAYWEQEHHGFAANGASDAFIKEVGIAAPEHFISGDDKFYNEHSKTKFHDQRWKLSLSAADQGVILKDHSLNRVLARMKLKMTSDGMESISPLPRLRTLWLRIKTASKPRMVHQRGSPTT